MGSKSFFSRLAYVLFPADSKGTNMIDRAVTTFKYGADDAWLARPNDPLEGAVIDAAERLALKMQVKVPRHIIIYQDDRPHSPHMLLGGIAIGTSMLHTLTPEQVDSQIAHQLSRHKHMDADMMAIPGIVTSATLAAEQMLKPYFEHKFVKKSPMLTKAAGIGRWGASAYAASVAVMPYLQHTVYRADHEAAVATTTRDTIDALQVVHDRQQAYDAQQGVEPSFVDRVMNATCRIATPSYQARIKELHDMRRNPGTHTHGGVFDRS